MNTYIEKWQMQIFATDRNLLRTLDLVKRLPSEEIEQCLDGSGFKKKVLKPYSRLRVFIKHIGRISGRMDPPKNEHNAIVLTRNVNPDDSSWNYQRVKLPKLLNIVNGDTGQKIWIKVISVTCQRIVLKAEKQSTNRILSGDNPEKFILISFAGFKFQDSPPKVTAEYITRLLKTGVHLNGTKYLFYGHSNSQLRSRTCFLYAASIPDIITKKIDGFGDFTKFNSVAKRAKRIGLLFSAAESSVVLKIQYTEDIPDVENEGYLFTDGCGMLSKGFASELARGQNILFHNSRYVPSSFQIRYKGYKGMLMVNPKLIKKASFRSSMKKFSGCQNDTFSVLDYSKPFTFAYLNGELVTLLSCLGIPDETFTKKQEEYFRFLKDAPNVPLTAFQFLCYKSKPELAEQVLLEGLTPALKAKVRQLVKEEWRSTFKESPSGVVTEKVRILIKNSRILFGVCDYRGQLKEGECHVRITSETGGHLTLFGAEVIVSRNPALHPGDIRKFRVTQVEELNHLVDCIVFPIVGRRDAASLMSGGDLDGDKFFVSWDPDIIPSVLSEPYGYPAAKEVNQRKITHDDMIRYFANYTNASLGRVKNLYLDWARVKEDSVLSKECQQLNTLFSSCVDGEQIRVPEQLENPPKPAEGAKPFILDLLTENVKRIGVNLLAPSIDDPPLPAESGSLELLLEILASSEICLVDEFNLFSLTFRWCQQNNQHSIEEFLPYFNFGDFTTLQKNAVFCTLTAEDPDLRRQYIGPIYNGLFQSEILTRNELKQQFLDYHNIRWQLLYASYHDAGGRLYSSIEKAMQDFDKKLLVFNVDEQLKIGLYIPKRVEKGKSVAFPERKTVQVSRRPQRNGMITSDVTDYIRIFAFEPLSGHSYKRTTSYGYELIYDDEVIQLYEKRKSNSLIWFALNDKFSQRAGIKKNPNESNTEFKVSIALQKVNQLLSQSHHRVTKQASRDIEVYVISNRDRVGHQILDISMSQVDTVETKKILQNLPRDYDLNLDGNVADWKNREFCESIIVNGDLDELRTLDICQVEQVIDCCLGIGNDKALFQIFHALLNDARSEEFFTSSDKLRQCVWLKPSLSILIIPALEEKKIGAVDKDFVLDILLALVMSLNELRDIGSMLFRRILAVLKAEEIFLSITEMIDLVKRILFTVRDSNLAEELVLEIIEGDVKVCGVQLESSKLFKFACHFTLALAMEYLGEVKENCPVNIFGIPIGAEEFSDSKDNPSPTSRLLNPSNLSDFLPDGLRQGDNGPLDSEIYDKVLEPHQICLEITYSKEAGLYETILRTDIICKIRNEDHIRFCASKRPSNYPMKRIAVFDAVVTSINRGKMEFRILQQEPLELTLATWNLYICGSTTNLNTQLAAIQTLIEKQSVATVAYSDILGLHLENPEEPVPKMAVELPQNKFNESQAQAIKEAVNNPVTLIWGPPGTGKTTVVVEIIMQYLKLRPGLRLLITASTHNAVDNVMERFLEYRKKEGVESDEDTIRLTSEVSKVSPALKKWTLDAFVGKDIHTNDKAKREALKKLKLAKLVFSTCSGAGVGMLRSSETKSPLSITGSSSDDDKKKKSEQKFDIVIVDEASQITEPNALIPIVKSSKFVVLVGDHVQLCPTVTEIGKKYGLDRSLFEKMYTDPSISARKVMLDVQYRMHPTLAKFPSSCFYEGKLKSGVSKEQRVMPVSKFPWPSAMENSDEAYPCVFIPCPTPESYGSASKSNLGQINMASTVVSLLRDSTDPVKPIINILTPYTQQVTLMRAEMKPFPGVEVNTIDGFQGREADIIIFSTVRANLHKALGFLNESRRINVALTRAKYGLIILGHEETLSSGDITRSMIASCKKLMEADYQDLIQGTKCQK